MIKRSFLGYALPQLQYDSDVKNLPAPKPVRPAAAVTLLLPLSARQTTTLNCEVGDRVKTGQKIALADHPGVYTISSVTGTISAVNPFPGDFGQQFLGITVTVAAVDEVDSGFKDAGAEPSLTQALAYLAQAPGLPPLSALNDPQYPISTVVVCGVDDDLLVATQQHVLQADIRAVGDGITVLKQITGGARIVLVAPPHLMQDAVASGAEVKITADHYPATLPHMIMKDCLGQVLPAGKRFEELGVCFMTAEAVAALGKAFAEGRLPVVKRFTLINKEGAKSLVAAPIGTPLKDIFQKTGITLQDRDRIIMGGPFRGHAVFSDTYPVRPDTDAVMVQDRVSVPLSSDYPCINCGDCVRVCPAQMPVNMLVRFLEAGQYEAGAEDYDLFSCIECGLCSFVCVAKIPIFQYIRLAKYELGRTNPVEAEHVEAE
jgi:electron transport complex protein RnfC